MAYPSLRQVAALSLVGAALVYTARHLPDSNSREAPAERPSRSARPAAVADAPAGPPPPPGAVRPEDARRLTLERLAYAHGWDGPMPAELAAFRAWTHRYLAAPAAIRADIEAEGIALARERRAAMRTLIVRDPQQALALTVPAAVRQQLPPAIEAQLETRLAGRGDHVIEVSQPLPGAPAGSPLRRIVSLGGATYQAHAYGRREGQLTKEGASLHGIAIDGEMAVHDSPVRVLDPGEAPPFAAEPACPCGESVPAVEPRAAANLGPLEFIMAEGRLLRLHDPATELERIEQTLLRAEARSGPRVPALRAMLAGEADDAPMPHTLGEKRTLVIRVDFSDVPGEPIAQAEAAAVLNEQVRPFLDENSYGLTTVTGTVTGNVYRMPRTAASYAVANESTPLINDARAAAAAHHDVAGFDRVIVVTANLSASRIPGSRFTFAGRGNLGGSNSIINGAGSFVYTTVSHELGHNYGLLHGNLWQVADGNPVSAGGNTLEYGDPFDMMGSTFATGVTRDMRHHYSHWGKNHVGWLPDSAVTTVTSSGTYRVHRFDSKAAPRDRPLALRVFRDGVRWYWIGLRQNFVTGTPNADGAYVVWGHNQRLQTQVLDLTTPGVSANDAALRIGETFTDPAYGITIRPVARGGAEPEQWLDVEIVVPARPPNVVTAWGREGATFYDTESGKDLVPAPETNVPMTLSGVQAIAGGDQHMLALRTDGTVIAWGDHINGQTAVPAGLSGVVSLAAGADYSGVVLKDGTVRLWGAATHGVTSPPPGLNEVKQLALGRDHALALRADGTVVAWGANARGQTNVPAGLRDVAAIAAGSEFSLALRRDGTVVGWGSSLGGAVPAGLTGVAAISALGTLTGGQFAVALKSDGTVTAWGANNVNQTVVPPGLTNVVAVAAGGFHTLALKDDGTVVAFGNDTVRKTRVPPGLPRSVAIAATQQASFVLTGSRVSILTQPESRAIAAGTGTTLSVEASGERPLTYQWRKDGVAIPGATAATLALARTSGTDAGTYDVIVSDGANAFPSAAARLTVEGAEVSRIANLSIRTNAGTGAQMLIVGFVVGAGSGSKPLLVRGVGPTLGTFGVDRPLSNPKLEVFNGTSAKLFDNDDWAAADAPVFSSVGAFPLTDGSRDAALYQPAMAPGSYSAQLSGVDGATGIALAEIYDATDGAGFDATTSRLVNVSARTMSGTGADVLIAGFVIAGPSPKTVLIRAIGPGLVPFGVTDVLTDPRLDLFDSSRARVQENDNWSGTTALADAFRGVGAFALDPASRDAALVVRLAPGSYTAQVSGVGNTTGVALVEIYEVPE